MDLSLIFAIHVCCARLDGLDDNSRTTSDEEHNGKSPLAAETFMINAACETERSIASPISR
jgi:hypothetical protein